MALTDQVTSLATRVGQEIKILKGRVKTLEDKPASSGSADIKKVEVDFGVSAYPDTLAITVTDASVSAGQQILASQGGEAATGRQADENEMDLYTVNANAGAGTITFNVSPLAGSSLQGKSVIYYQVG